MDEQLMNEGVLKRIMPNSPEAEQSVIGAMVMDVDAVEIASEILVPEDFYQSQFQVLFESMVELYNERIPIDPVTLKDKIGQKSVPPELASLEYLQNLLDSVPTSSNVGYYANIVKEKSILRKLIQTTKQISEQCYQGKETLDDLLDQTEKSIFNIVQNRSATDFQSIGDIVVDAMRSIEAAARSSGEVTGIPTGFFDLDYKTAGFQKNNLILIAARPAMGKTAFVLNIANYIAVKHNTVTALFSLEMSKVDLVKRILSMHSKVDSQKMRKGNLEDEEWEKLLESTKEVGSSKLLIDDSSMTIADIRTKCRKFKMEQNLGLVIIDYLQLMNAGGRVESRQQEISTISRALKMLAMELNIPIIALSQLSRAVEARPDKRPMLSDLRESGAIEQDADVVMFIYRDDYYNHDSDEPGVAEIIIGKQRSGPTGTVKLGWQPEYTKFVNLQRE